MTPFFRYKVDHIIFWSATVLFHMYTRWSMIDNFGPTQFVLEIIVRNGLLAMAIYFNLNFLIPRFARTGRWFAYGSALFGVIVMYVVLKDAHDAFIQRQGVSYLSDTSSGTVNQSFYNLSIAVFYVSFSVALELSREWFRQRELLQRIAFDQVNTELAYLKAQINPHFLFNSINTIYFQIDKDNRIAREMLSTFADMLRYQLYECNGSSIAIEKEAAYLRNYVDLQRMRRDGHYSIQFSADSSVAGFQIAPLLLLPFVENAFKHVSHGPNVNEIEITLSCIDSKFRLMVLNSREMQNGKSGGIGLQNVRRRLELLYNNRHTLSIDESSTHYRVQLELEVEAFEKEAGPLENTHRKNETER